MYTPLVLGFVDKVIKKVLKSLEGRKDNKDLLAVKKELEQLRHLLQRNAVCPKHFYFRLHRTLLIFQKTVKPQEESSV